MPDISIDVPGETGVNGTTVTPQPLTHDERIELDELRSFARYIAQHHQDQSRVLAVIAEDIAAVKKLVGPAMSRLETGGLIGLLRGGGR